MDCRDQLDSLFSFQALPAGSPSRQNWYQELLDHPMCQNNPRKIQEAYEYHRSTALSRSISHFKSMNVGPAFDLQDSRLIKKDTALIQHLSWLDGASLSTEPLPCSPANCLVLWARPPTYILKTVQILQDRLASLVGKDLYLIPLPHIHLSVLELSHKHPIADLRATYQSIGKELVQKMLNYPLSGHFDANNRESAAWLVKPQLMMDPMGVAVTFVPDCDTSQENMNAGNRNGVNVEYSGIDREPFTYHHLRASLQALALTSGLQIDTCYTAATAHITIARFISSDFFDGINQHNGSFSNSRVSDTMRPTYSSSISEDDISETRSERRKQWVELVLDINKELREQFENQDTRGKLEWVVGQEKGLELQLGYIKFGRNTERAEIVGQCHDQHRRTIKRGSQQNEH